MSLPGPLCRKPAKRAGRPARKAVAWAIRHDIDLVLIAGDLFETHRPPAPLWTQPSRDFQSLSTPVSSGDAARKSRRDQLSRLGYREKGNGGRDVLIENPNMQKAATLRCRGSSVHIYSLAYTSGLTRTHPPLAYFPRPDGDGFHIALSTARWTGIEATAASPSTDRPWRPQDTTISRWPHSPSYRPGTEDAYRLSRHDRREGFDDPGVGFYTVVTLSTAGASVETAPADDALPLTTLSVDAGEYEDDREMVAALRRVASRPRCCSGGPDGLSRVHVAKRGDRGGVGGHSFYVQVVGRSAGHRGRADRKAGR